LINLEHIWPEYVKTVLKLNRPHHSVSWKKFFKHPLIRIKDAEGSFKEKKRTLELTKKSNGTA